MKKTHVISLSLICLFIFTLTLMGCVNCDNTMNFNSEIDGTWSNNNIQLVFSGSNRWVQKINGENHSNGYYRIDEKAKTIQIVLYNYWVDNDWVLLQSNEIMANLDYELHDNILILKNNDNEEEIPMDGDLTSSNSTNNRSGC